MLRKKAHIIGTGKYLPKKVLTNVDLEKMVDTSDEWIRTRTGIEERRIAEKDEFTSQMGKMAAEEAMKNAGISAGDLDCILVSTLTPDYIFPSTACLLQDLLGAGNITALDIQAACTGYIYALSIAKALIESGEKSCVLVVASEKLSSIVNYEDRSTCVLFGDGSSACVVSGDPKGLAIKSLCLGSDGAQWDLLKMPGGGCRNPASPETLAQNMHYVQMAGSEVFKHAVLRMESSSKECLSKAGLREEDVNWLVPHQANMRIIHAIAKRFTHLPKERIYQVLRKYGNTSCASVGIALSELLAKELVEEGNHLLLTAFGAGFTWGSCVLTMEKDTVL